MHNKFTVKDHRITIEGRGRSPILRIFVFYCKLPFNRIIAYLKFTTARAMFLNRCDAAHKRRESVPGVSQLIQWSIRLFSNFNTPRIKISLIFIIIEKVHNPNSFSFNKRSEVRIFKVPFIKNKLFFIDETAQLECVPRELGIAWVCHSEITGIV